MKGNRKITLEVPGELLAEAQKASRAGITETVRAGLRLLATQHAYEGLRRYRGKLRLGMTWQQIKDDR